MTIAKSGIRIEMLARNLLHEDPRAVALLAVEAHCSARAVLEMQGRMLGPRPAPERAAIAQLPQGPRTQYLHRVVRAERAGGAA